MPDFPIYLSATRKERVHIVPMTPESQPITLSSEEIELAFGFHRLLFERVLNIVDVESGTRRLTIYSHIELMINDAT